MTGNEVLEEIRRIIGDRGLVTPIHAINTKAKIMPAPAWNTRRQDVYNAMAEIQRAMSLWNGIPAEIEGKTVCGFPVDAIIQLAIACRRQGVLEDDLLDFVRNMKRGFQAGREEFYSAAFYAGWKLGEAKQEDMN